MISLEVLFTCLVGWALVRSAQILMRRLREKYYETEPDPLDQAILNDEIANWSIHTAKVVLLVVLGLDLIFFVPPEPPEPLTFSRFVLLFCFVGFAVLLVARGEAAQHYYRRRRILFKEERARHEDELRWSGANRGPGDPQV